MPSYMRIPTPAEFKKDSYVLFAVRKNQHTIDNIDKLLASYHDSQVGHVSKFYALLQLRFLTMSWLADVANAKSRRQQAVDALHRVVTDEMKRSLGAVGEADFDAKLAAFLARPMTQHGQRVDGMRNAVTHIAAEDIWRYGVYPQGGKLYQYPWYDKHQRDSLTRGSAKELIETQTPENLMSSPARYGTETDNHHGGFVMTLDRKVYMARHDGNAFHSQYTGGQPVICAGTLRIHKGVLRCISNASGHYQPGIQRLLPVIDWFYENKANLSKVYLKCVKFEYNQKNEPRAVGYTYYRAEEVRKKRSLLGLTKVEGRMLPRDAE